MNRKSVLLIGDPSYREFRDATAWLSLNASLTYVTHAAEACEYLSNGPSVDAIVMLQARPGQFHDRHVEAMYALSPLSRLVMLLGSWCEGELRTGKPCRGVLRIFWHQWDSQMIPEFVDDVAPSHGIWQLPRTATLGEQFQKASLIEWPEGSGVVLVSARSLRTFQPLSAVCRVGGYAAVWCRPSQPVFSTGAMGVIYDGIGCDDWETRQILDLARRCAPAAVIALLDFVRPAHRERLIEGGVSAVVAKPLLIYDLLWHLCHASSAAARPAAVSSAA